MNSYVYMFQIKNSLMSPVLRQIRFSPMMICRNVKYTTFVRPADSTKLIKHALPLKSALHVSYRQSSLLTLAKDPKHYNPHSSVWIAERIFAVGMLVTIPFLVSGFFSRENEGILDILIAMHMHWGISAICRDYLRPAVVGKVIPKFIGVGTAFITLTIGTGLLCITFKGRGVLRTIHQLWIVENDDSYDSKYETFSKKQMTTDKTAS